MNKPLAWIKNNLHPDGGVRAWADGPAYPEVSGYLIPTLLDYGEQDLVTRLADWLVDIQNDDGSFNDMDGQKRSFDTAAVMQGLSHYFFMVGGKRNYLAAKKALDWLLSMERDDGAMRIIPESDETHLYTMRVSAHIVSHKGTSYWMDQEWPDTREHYIAYALEGLWIMDEHDFVREKLLERDWTSDDLCANAQMAILYHKAGINANHLVNLVESRNGEISNSWTAKWMLDMWRVVGES